MTYTIDIYANGYTLRLIKIKNLHLKIRIRVVHCDNSFILKLEDL